MYCGHLNFIPLWTLGAGWIDEPRAEELIGKLSDICIFLYEGWAGLNVVVVLGCLVIVVGLGLFLGASELEGLLFEGDEHEGVGAGSWGVEHEYVVQGAWDYFFGLRVPEDPWEHRQTFLGF